MSGVYVITDQPEPGDGKPPIIDAIDLMQRQDDRPVSAEPAGVLREALLDAVQDYGMAARCGERTEDALQRIFDLSRELRDRADQLAAEREERR